MPSNPHIVIAGPGRSGTTVLVRLLDRLGFETHADRLKISAHAHAGLETDLLAADAPHVVKDPTLTWRLREMIESGRLNPRQIEWLVLPVRSLDEAAASRIRISAERRDIRADGGLVGVARPRKQREWLATKTYALLETAARYELPLILLEYPRFATDPAYAFRQLKPLLPTHSLQSFESAWRQVVDPELVRTGQVAVPPLMELRMAALRLRSWARRRVLGSLRQVARRAG